MHSSFFGKIDRNPNNNYLIGLPCSNNFHLQTIEFNGPKESTAVRGCLHTSSFDHKAYEYDVSEIAYTNFDGRFIDLGSVYMGRTILYDADGTFTNNTSLAPLTLVRNFSYFKG